MPKTARDLLLPTELVAFLRACGRYNIQFNAFRLTFHVRQSADGGDGREHVVRIMYRKNRIEKDYVRHVWPTWTTVFDLDLMSGHFDLKGDPLAAYSFRLRRAAPSEISGGNLRD
jgi:hypothetical protein